MISVSWIIEFIATLCECFLCVVFCSTFMSESNHKAIKFVSPVILSLLIFWINNINPYSPVTVFVTFILYFISLSVIYLKDIFKISLLTFLYLLILSTADNIVLSSISLLLNIPKNEIYRNTFEYYYISMIASKALFTIFIISINKFIVNKKNTHKKYIFILIIITIIISELNIILTYINIKNNSANSYIPIFFFVIILILIMTIFFGTFKLMDYYESQQQLNLMKLKNDMLEQSLSDTKQSFELIQTSLHDYKHNIINLMALARNNDISGIMSYLEKENELLSKTLFYCKTGNETVDIMIYTKQKIAESHGITFIVNTRVGERCPIVSEHFASILGNLLDNAIEACDKEENPFIEVRMNEVGEYFWIIVANKYTNTDVSLNTSKKNKYLHGIGLRSVRRNVKSYHGDINITTDNQKFEIKIMIPLNENPA